MTTFEIHTIGKIRAAYNALVDAEQIEPDPVQIELVEKLDQRLQEIANRSLSNKSSALGWLFGKQQAKQEQPKGLYIWGDVGRGKSMLMDMFYEHLPDEGKKRVHFNEFMSQAQELIHQHRNHDDKNKNGNSDPIPAVARELTKDLQVLCFDEFTVTDIADAMILSRLFEEMFKQNIMVIATSNVEPENLYKDGLNRKIFMPFIDLLEKNVEVFELISRTDYRLEKLNQAPVYYTPINQKNKKAMDAAWQRLTGVQKGVEETLVIKGRELIVPQVSAGAARLSFKELCEQPRSALDYLAIAHKYHTLFIDDIPIMNKENHNAAKRFILLIDTLYDNHIRIVILAQAKPEELYQAQSGTEAFEFKRTISRLHEIQSVEYIAAARQ